MIREQNGTGTAYRRVLDLLAGWFQYADASAEAAKSDEERAVYTAEADAVQEVYQRLGRLGGPYDKLDRLAEETLKSTVMTLVLFGAPGRRTDSDQRTPYLRALEIFRDATLCMIDDACPLSGDDWVIPHETVEAWQKARRELALVSPTGSDTKP